MFARKPTEARKGVELDASLAAARSSPKDVIEVRMTVQNNSMLAISWMPTLRYMPKWSPNQRTAVGQVLEVDGSRIRVLFDAGVRNPGLGWRTTFINAFWPLRIPLIPPGVEIDIKSKRIEGWIDLATGLVDFDFESEFGNTFCGMATAHPLQVTSKMTSEPQEGKIFSACGQRIQEDASAKLIALSLVPKTEDPIQNFILRLPTDALSILNVKFEFVLKGKGPI